MSDTPRTAERFDEILRGYGEWGPGAQASARWWAESLERELAAAQTEIENLAGSAEPLRTTLAEVKRQLASANAAREESEDAIEHVAQILAGAMDRPSHALESRVSEALQYINRKPRTAYYTSERENLMLAADNNINRAVAAEERLKEVEAALKELLVELDGLSGAPWLGKGLALSNIMTAACALLTPHTEGKNDA